MILKTPIKTQRLILQPPSLDDFDRFFAMSKDPEVMQYIGDGSIFHWTHQVARDKFRLKLAAPNVGLVGTMAVYRQMDRRYLGWSAITVSKFLGGQELGYRLCRDAWGCGYATEAAAGLLAQADTVMDLNHIQACVHPNNTTSIRVLEKLGFVLVDSKMSKPAGRDIFVYQMDRAAFVASGMATGSVLK